MTSDRKRPRASTEELPSARLTIKEIAEEAGVSTATVSRVINSPVSVSKRRREAVLEIIERHDYVTHGMAGALAGARSKTIGVVIPTITNSIYAATTQAIQRAAQRENFGVLLGVSEFSPEEERRLIRHLIERRVDGLILTGAHRDPAIHRLIDRHNIPCIVTWRIETASHFPCVGFDNYQAARLAMSHLINLGHRRIGLICGRTDVNDRALERRKGYQDALAEERITLDPALIFERDFDFAEGRSAMRQMLLNPSFPTAVFAANDIQAVGALTECRSAGKRVPEDISIVGFDDLPLAEFTEPPLTTIRVPGQKMGEVAAQRLIEMILGDKQGSSEVLPVEFVLRKSTANAVPLVIPPVDSG